jgi:hypothetical protein
VFSQQPRVARRKAVDLPVELPGLSFWEHHLPWALLKILQTLPQNQATSPCRRRQCPTRRPRTRRCLLKGCEQRFRPQRARELSAPV